MKTVVIIQARVGSTRLPGKVMKIISGSTVLEHVIKRVSQSKEINDIVIATTTLNNDDIIIQEAKKNNVKWYRGSVEDVLSRYYYAAVENKAELVVRITSDCPLIDPQIMDEIISFSIKSDYDLVTNAGVELSNRTYPRGLDVEIFTMMQLETAFKKAREKYQREHVTPYIYENAKKIFYYKNNHDYSGYRWTLDTDEDFMLISKIYEKLYRGEHNFYLKDILALYGKYPELALINKHIEQKKYQINI